MTGTEGSQVAGTTAKATPRASQIGFLCPRSPHPSMAIPPSGAAQWALHLLALLLLCSILITGFSFKVQLADPRPHARTMWLGGGEVVGAGPVSHQQLTGESPDTQRGLLNAGYPKIHRNLNLTQAENSTPLKVKFPSKCKQNLAF